jgi:hypothetical protein
MTRWELLWKWWEDSPEARFLLGVIFLVALGIFYFRMTAGTGWSLFLIICVVLVIVWSGSPTLEALFPFVLVPVWILGERHQKAHKGKYLPPIVSVAGAGIKRGLTAPEAGVLLEKPLGKVLTLVVFGLLKKGLVEQTQDDPLAVTVPEQYRGSTEERKAAARAAGTIIRNYEHDFLQVLAEQPGVPLEKLNFSDAMQKLIKKTAERLAGFDLDQTREYYVSLVNKAWGQARSLGEIERRDEYVDDNLLWLFIVDDSRDRFDTWHHHGYRYRPAWTRGTSTGTGIPRAPSPGGRTSFSDVAASFAGWSENVTGNLANTLDPVSVGQKTGALNLSGVDKVSMDVLRSMAEGGGSGGGGGGGCACAGCACACACAGGGR